MGDLIIDFQNKTSKRVLEVSALLSSYGLNNLMDHYQQHRRHRDKTTFHKMINGSLVKSRCDYILSNNRRYFKTVTIRDLRHFTSDHYMVVAKLLASPTASHKRYLRGRKKFPLPPPPSPLTKADHLFNQLKARCLPPPKKSTHTRLTWLAPSTIKLLDTRCSLR
jgi:hypothetical protein